MDEDEGLLATTIQDDEDEGIAHEAQSDEEEDECRVCRGPEEEG